MRINIAGDYYLSDSYLNTDLLSKEVIKIFEGGNINILNLESPITNSAMGTKILKTGPHLCSSPRTAEILKALHIHLVTLANNHIMDYGVQGLEDTFRFCHDQQISCVGAGVDLESAAKPFFWEKDGVRIAVLNVAENEWASAGKEKAGASPLSIIDNAGQIRSAKEQTDIVIVIIHGGHEHYPLPSLRMKKQYRFYAENGASVIVCHHTHCFSGYEVYKKVPIIYGLGNFLFTYPSTFDSWYRGLILSLKISGKNKVEFELIPVKQQRNTFAVDIINGTEKEQSLMDIDRYCGIIANESQLKDHWRDFLEKHKEEYLDVFNPVNTVGNRYLRAIIRRLKLDKIFMQGQNYPLIMNHFRCESHAEATIGVLDTLMKENYNIPE